MIDGRNVGFERIAKQQIFGDDHIVLAKALDIQPGERIALIGAGFGWVAEDWINMGLGPIVNTDISRWIQQNLNENAVLPILNEDSLTEQSRANVLNAIGGHIDWVITEDCLPILSDEECIALVNALHLYGGKVAHWVSCSTPSSFGGLNWKTDAEWKQMVGPDLVIRRGSGEVL
jgi:hypothetical protein